MLLLNVSGCANKIVLHPLTEADIYNGKSKGDICFSGYYLENVLQVAIDKSK